MEINEQIALKLAKIYKLNLDVIPLQVWQFGLNVELEHGTKNKLTNVTKDDIHTTAKIALAHLIEFPDYYQRLKKMESEAEDYWLGKQIPSIFIEEQSGGRINMKKHQVSWDKKVKDRKKELESIMITNSYIPKNKIKKTSYETHDNGGRPFEVKVSKNNIWIGAINRLDNAYKELLELNKFDGYWYGFDSSPYKMHGNSILVKLNNHKYMFIRDKIYTFETTDIITDYVSPVGNSDVSYPVAYGDSNIYFMLDAKFIPKIKLNTKDTVSNAEDMYGEFYKRQMSGIAKPMKKVKILQKRLLG